MLTALTPPLPPASPRPQPQPHVPKMPEPFSWCCSTSCGPTVSFFLNSFFKQSLRLPSEEVGPVVDHGLVQTQVIQHLLGDEPGKHEREGGSGGGVCFALRPPAPLRHAHEKTRGPPTWRRSCQRPACTPRRFAPSAPPGWSPCGSCSESAGSKPAGSNQHN